MIPLPPLLLLLLLFFGTLFPVFTQTPDSAFWYFQEGKRLAYTEMREEARQALLISSDLYEARQLWDSCILMLLRTKVALPPAKHQEVLDQAKSLATQHLPPSHGIWADIYCYEGEMNNTRKNLLEAKSLFDKALQICEDRGDQKRQTTSRIHLGKGLNYFMAADLPNTIREFETSIAIGKEMGLAPMDMNVTMQNLAIAYVHAGNTEKALVLLIESSRILEEYLPEDIPFMSLGRIYGSIGSLYDQQRAFHRSAVYYEKELSIQEALLPPNHPDLARSYRHIASSYKETDEFDQALIYQKRAYDIDVAVYGEDTPELAIDHYGLANYYSGLLNTDKALYHSEKCIQLERLKPKHAVSNLPYAYSQKGLIYSWMGELSKAIDSYHKGIQVGIEYGATDISTFPILYLNLGRSYTKAGQFEEAEQWLTKYLERTKQIHPAQHPEIACAWTSLGELERYKNNASACLSHTEKAIEIFLPKLTAQTSSIPIQEIPLGYLGDVLASLNQKSISYLMDFQKSSNPDFLHQAWDNQQLILGLLDSLYLQKIEQNSQQSFQTSYHHIYQNAQNILYALYQASTDDHYIQEALRIAERNKANVLRKAFLKSRLYPNQLFPPSVHTTDQAYKDRLLELDQQMERAQFQQDSLLMGELGTMKFDLLMEYQAFEKQLETDYPAYFRQIYSLASPSIEDIQQDLLTESQVLIEYSWEENNLYMIAISTEDVVYKQIPHSPSFIQQLVHLRKLVSPEEGLDIYDRENVQSSHREILDASEAVYAVLVSPLAAILEKAEKLVIISDDELGYLPFGMLANSKDSLLDKSDFLINHYDISYAFSASLLAEMTSARSNVQADIPLLVMAPSFKDFLPNKAVSYSRDSYFPLPFSEHESEIISNTYNGNLYSDSLATKREFKALAPSSRIVHLATHAKAFSKDSKFSHIAFSSASNVHEQDNHLQVSEIYAMNLPADMVVLSACETGLGEIKKGEGIISLGRAFTYAGAKSIISTLWSVNDQSTSELMISFYRYLDQGMRKDAALRQAKLDYLNSNDNQFSHPYFWAAPIAIGDMSPVELRTRTNWWWLGVLLLLIFGGSLVWIKKKHSQS